MPARLIDECSTLRRPEILGRCVLWILTVSAADRCLHLPRPGAGLQGQFRLEYACGEGALRQPSVQLLCFYAPRKKEEGMDRRMYRQSELAEHYVSTVNIFGVGSPVAKASQITVGPSKALVAALSALLSGIVYVFVCLKAIHYHCRINFFFIFHFRLSIRQKAVFLIPWHFPNQTKKEQPSQLLFFCLIRVNDIISCMYLRR